MPLGLQGTADAGQLGAGAIISGLRTEVCVVLPVLSALGQGYEVHVVADASGGVTPQAHEHALRRMIGAGALPVTWIQVLLELQRGWAHAEIPRSPRRPGLHTGPRGTSAPPRR